MKNKKFITIGLCMILTLFIASNVLGGLNDDVVHHWKFNVNSSTQNDSVGSAHGTVSGAIYDTTGKINADYIYDGIDDKISLGNTASLTSGAMSLGFWVDIDSITDSGGRIIDRTNNYIFWIDSAPQGGDFSWIIYTTTGSPRQGYTNTAIPTTGYQNIVLTYNGTSVDVYVNNVLQNITEISTGTGAITDSATAAYIGARAANDRNFDGNIDALTLWDDALTVEEISDFYNDGDGQEYPFTDSVVDTNTSALGEVIEIPDFTVSGDADQLVESIEINTTKDHILAFPLTLNAQKTVISGTNQLRLRVDLDGYTIFNDTIRTMTTLNTGSTGAFPSNTTTAGVHTIDIYMSETGIGNVDVTNFDMFIGTPETTSDGSFDFDASSGTEINVSLSAGQTKAIYNMTIETDISVPVLNIFDIKAVDNSTPEIRFWVNNTNKNDAITPMFQSITTGITGATGLNGYLTDTIVGLNNYSLYVYSEDATDLQVTLSHFMFPMVDNQSYIMHGLNHSNNTDPSINTTRTSGTYQLIKEEFEIFEGDSLFMHHSGSHSSVTGDVSSQIFVNISNSTHSLYSFQNLRDFSTSKGNQYMLGQFEGLTPGNKYNITVTQIISGGSLISYTDNLMLLETSRFGLFEELDITAPNVTLLNPANTSQYFTGNLVGSCDDKFSITDVSINDSRWYFNTSSNFQNWSFIFNSSGTFNGIPVMINCTDISDNIGSQNYNLLIDTVEPVITINSPSQGDRTNTSIYLDIIATDDRLFNASTILYFPNSSIAFENTIEDINTSLYNFTWIYNFTAADPEGIWNVSVKACDSHTKNHIDEWSDISKGANGYINIGECMIYPDANMNDINDFWFTKEYDRYTWTYDYLRHDSTVSYFIECTDNGIDNLVYLEDSPYKGHFVDRLSRRWFDFETDEGYDVDVTRINSHKYRVSYLDVPNEVTSISTNSVGELNCNYRSVTFEYVNGTLEDLPSYTPPAIIQDALIGNIPETLSEAMMLFFILALCIVVTVFAATDKSRGWWFFASITWVVFGLVIIPYSFAFGFIFLLGSLGLMFSKLF